MKGFKKLFEKIIGNQETKIYLENTIKNKKIANSYMFIGNKGIGKKLFAREYAKNIMCQENGKCNDQCNSCIKFNANSNPDYYELVPENQKIKIDNIRLLQEKIAEKPIISNKKIYVIDNADLMTEESQNCLLKTLEEPPEYSVIILVVSNESKILPTIKSRCIKINFSRLTPEELKKYLEVENKLKQYSNEDLNDIIELLDGSLEKVDTIEEKKKNYDELNIIVENLEKGNKLELFNNSEILYNQKENIIDILSYMNIILFKRKMINAVEIVEKTKKKILANNNYEMCIDYLIINITNP